MSCQRSFWSRIQLAKQLKRDNVSHGEVTIHYAATVSVHTNTKYKGILLCNKQHRFTVDKLDNYKGSVILWVT